MTGEEQKRRKYQRVKHHFIVRFRVYQSENPEESRKWDIVTVRDLSAGGILFNYNKKIPLGTALEFNISLPPPLEAVCCQGTVCRVDEQPLSGKDIKKIPIYGIAASFTELENGKKKALDALIKHLPPYP